MSFSDFDEQKLINVVAKHPELYDPSNANYRNILGKENIWKAIGKQLNKNSEDCKKKWKFVRDGYTRFRKKHKMDTGSTAPRNSKDKRHQQLLFLASVSQNKAEDSNIAASPQWLMDSDKNFDVDPLNSDEQGGSGSGHVNLDKSCKHEKLDSDGDDTADVKNIFIPKIETGPIQQTNDDMFKTRKERHKRRRSFVRSLIKKKDDDVELFCRHIAEVLRNLPPVEKAQAKKHLYAVLSDYEIMAAKHSSERQSTSLLYSDLYTSSSDISPSPERHTYNSSAKKS